MGNPGERSLRNFRSACADFGTRAGAAGNFLAPLTQLSSNAFKTVIDIDVLGSYNTVKAVLPHLEASAKKHAHPARLIFVSATLHYTGTPLQTHVVAAKAGVDSLSNNCAIELGPRGITSNIIAPGAIGGTEGMERLARKEDLDRTVRHNPMQRMGTVKDIADATVFLCSDTGEHVNGDRLVGELTIFSASPACFSALMAIARRVE